MHPNCLKCKLHAHCQTPFMESFGAEDPLIMVIGDAPNASDDRNGIPFLGGSGKLMRDMLEAMDFDLSDDVRFTNVIRCMPTAKISARIINYCKHFMLADIEKYNPSIVLLMGNSPLNAVLGESGITTWNGVSVERDGRLYIPLYHPSYIINNPEAQPEWLDGFAKILDEPEHGDSYEYVLVDTVNKCIAMGKHLMQSPSIAYDTETSSLDAHGSLLLCASLAGDGIKYTLPLDHEDNYVSDVVYTYIVDALEHILENHPRKVGHNMKFDIQQTRGSLDILYAAQSDTMLMSHLLDSRKGIHSLKRLAGLHLGMYDYDKPLDDYKKQNVLADPRRGGSYAAIPGDILFPYAALDVEATLKLDALLYARLSAKQRIFYEVVLMPVMHVLADMEFNGNAVDRYVIDRYVRIYSAAQQRMFRELMVDPRVSKTEKRLQKIADGKLKNKLPDGATIIKLSGDYLHYRNAAGRELKRKRAVIAFNPNSTDHLRELYYKVCKVPIVGHTETGAPTTSIKALKHLTEDYPIIELVGHYKLLTKMLGTYLIPAQSGDWMSVDDRVRSNYNLHGTRTGRLSSSNPNMQNIPTPEKEASTRPMSVVVNQPVKNLFTHSHWIPQDEFRALYPGVKMVLNGGGLASGGVLMSVDYSGMELRVFASLARCQPMLDIHERGWDFHSMVAIMASEGKTIDEIQAEEVVAFKRDKHAIRYRYKWTNWTLLYGGGKHTLMSLYGMSEAEADGTIKEYYSCFPEVLDFREQTSAFILEHGYIESPFGRREHLPYARSTDGKKRSKAKRSAVNMPVQSSASDILLCALIIIADKMGRANLRARMVNTVHDSIVFDVPLDELDEVAAICVDAMENVVTYSNEYFPGLDMSWMLSPLKADVEVGTHYGVEEGFESWKKSMNMT